MPGFQLSGPVRFALPGFLLRKIAGWRVNAYPAYAVSAASLL